MSSEPPAVPTGQKPDSYTDAFRGREAHTKFADPCEKARQVSPADSLPTPGTQSSSDTVELTLDWVGGAQESMTCLDKNSYNKTKCLDVSPLSPSLAPSPRVR